MVSQIDTTNHVPVPERRFEKIVKNRFQIVCGSNPWEKVCSSAGRFDENPMIAKPINRQGMKLKLYRSSLWTNFRNRDSSSLINGRKDTIISCKWVCIMYDPNRIMKLEPKSAE
jgi:hypothetical protein